MEEQRTFLNRDALGYASHHSACVEALERAIAANIEAYVRMNVFALLYETPCRVELNLAAIVAGRSRGTVGGV